MQLMKRFLIPLLAALALPLYAGIRESKKISKWMKIDNNWTIDTEDVDIKRSKLRFYVIRRATKDEIEGDTEIDREFTAKYRINCKSFTSKRQKRLFDGSYGGLLAQWQEIRPDTLNFTLANYFCFLTGEEGYTREEIEPIWAKKINDKYSKK